MLTWRTACAYFVRPPWTLVRENSERYTVQDANGVTVAWLFCRDGSARYCMGTGTLTADEARRIGNAIARIPELLMPRKGFHPRGSGPRWRADRPYHVAIEDNFCARTGLRATRSVRSTACRSMPPGRLSARMALGASMNSPGRWMPSCSAAPSRGAGCAVRNSTIPNGPPTPATETACQLAEIQPARHAIRSDAMTGRSLHAPR